MHFEHPPPCPPSCTHCLAYDNITRAICTRAPSQNSKWCAQHEELQAKLLKSYKRLTLAFESFDDSTLPASLDVILVEEDLPQLRTWSENSRSKWSLAKRVIVARAEHHQQFYAGGDWGHTLFVETLKSETQRMERFLRVLDRQAYKVTLAESEASWILDVPAGPSFVCNDGPPASKPDRLTGDAPLTPPPTPPLPNRELASSRTAKPPPRRAAGRRKLGRQPSSSSSGSSGAASPPFRPVVPSIEAENDAFFAALSAPCCRTTTSSPDDLLKHLRGYQVPPSDLAPTVQGETWTAVAETLFRHVVLRVPSLATLALSANVGSVTALLDLLETRLAEGGDAGVDAETLVGRLWKSLKFAKISSSEGDSRGKEKETEDNGLLGVGVLVEALDVVFGVEDAKHQEEHVALLGGKVWKNPKEADWPREAWDLFYQFVACPGCSLIATRSLSAWTTNRRLAALGHLPAWLGQSETSAERIFRLSGIVLCTSNSCQSGKKVKRVESKDSGKKVKGGKAKKVVFVEEWERSWMYVKLPLDNLRSALVLDYLASLPEQFTVLARQTVADVVTHEPQEPQASCSPTLRRCSCCESDALWLNKVRSGFTPVERKAARWTTTSFFPRESVLSSLLSSSSPESRFHSTSFSDTYDAVILDATPFTSATQDSWTTFADSVAQAVLAAQSCESIGELIWREKKYAVDRGEMREGEWEAMHACAVQEKPEAKGGRTGSKDEGAQERRVLYICEDELTARMIFRED
ncbi:hypothetical protein JCM11251_007390 [Rhodosporidiobolus azoricus]